MMGLVEKLLITHSSSVYGKVLFGSVVNSSWVEAALRKVHNFS